MWFIHSSAVCPCLADRSCALSLWMGVNWESQEVLLISIYYSGIWYINYDILYTLALPLSLMDHEIVLSMGISITTSGFLNWGSRIFTATFFFFLFGQRPKDNWENFPGFRRVACWSRIKTENCFVVGGGSSKSSQVSSWSFLPRRGPHKTSYR